MRKITAQEIAIKWNLSVRYIQTMCKQGRIPGAEKFGTNWMIPEDAPRPADLRKKQDKKSESSTPIPLIRKSPFLDMTDLYHIPGSADSCTLMLSSLPESQTLFAAEIAYSRGEIDKVYSYANELLQSHSSMYAIIAGGMLLGLCAMWRGDIELWKKAKAHICEIDCNTQVDEDIVFLSLACIESAIRDIDNYPDWFRHGDFENLPTDSHPAARVFYVKYLLVYAQELACGNLERDDVKGLAFMKSIPYIVEPMISLAVVEKTIMVEIYLRLLCAVAYHQTGEINRATKHLDRAIALCLADGLYGPLVEHRRQLGLFLDERLLLTDEAAAKKVKALHKELHLGWTKLHNAILEKNVNVSLSPREREIARMITYGMTNIQISKNLQLSVHTVNAIVNTIKNKTGAENRRELGLYI